MIELRSVTVMKGGRALLSEVTLSVPKGAFCSLIGPSGAGKTTLLRTIAGLESPASGSVAIDGRPMEGIPPHLRGVSLVFQDLALWPHRSVEGNLLLALSGRSDARVRAAESLSRWGLGGMERRMPETLSGGERQRLALARAWALDRPAMLLDEPASALDRPARAALLSELRGSGLTVLYVTHQQDEALRLSDRILVLMGGRVAQSGTRDDLLDRPASREVAEFLG